ncbi:hypothetical protein [Pandoraea aquatica]|nr:hypothetical protein [Pandoraea aquatica]
MADAPWSARVVHALVSAPASVWGPDDIVECDGQLFHIWVESPFDALPKLKVNETALNGVRSEVAGYLKPSDKSTLAPKTTEKYVTRAPRRTGDPLVDPSLVKWETVVSQWQAVRYGVEANETATLHGSLQTTTSASATLLEHGVSEVAPSTVALQQCWTPAFEAALKNVFERVEAGLLLWHFGRVPQVQRSLMLSRLHRTCGVGTIRLNDVRIGGVVAMKGDQGHMLLSLTTGEALWRGSTDVAINPDLRAFLARHLSDADAATLAHVMVDGGDPSQGLAVCEIVFETPTPDFTVLVQRAKQWFEDRITRGGNVPVERDHDLLYLIAQAARHTSDDEGQAIVALVRALVAPGENRYVPTDHIFRSESDEWHDAPSLPLAHFLGETMAGANFDEFADGPPPHRSAEQCEQCILDLLSRSRQRYNAQRVRGEAANLVEFALRHDTFGVAMLARSEADEDERFGPALAVVSDEVLPGGGAAEQDPMADAFRRIFDTADIRSIPPGYRIFLTGESPLDEARSDVHHEMLSLGGGQVAAWCRSRVEAPTPGTLRRLDLLSNNGFLNVTRNGATLSGPTPVTLWVEPGTPGVFGERIAAVVQSGRLTQTGIRRAMDAFGSDSVIATELKNNAPDKGGRFGRDKTALVNAIATRMRALGASDIKYRLILSWTGPNQAFPSMSLALTGRAPQSMRETVSPIRLVVDLFMCRALAAGAREETAIQGESDWLATYRRHAAGRCVQYREFENVTEIVSAIREYEAVPGVRAYDWREGTRTVSVPDWSNAAPLGWHPNRI